MLLNEEKKRELVNEIIAAAKVLLRHLGRKMVDPTTGFTHMECRTHGFVVVEHQRQKLAGGEIKTNGLDLWQVVDGNARKLLSVNYVPLDIKYFYKSGKAPWIQTFLELGREDVV